jgi:hypothetical protein
MTRTQKILADIGEILGADAYKYMNVCLFLHSIEDSEDPRALEIFKAFELVQHICLGVQK